MLDTDSHLPSSNASIELSVIVPCLNEELNIPELSERILGVFEAGGLRGELIIVNDGSTDGTAEVIRQLALAHPDVIIGCNHPENRGIAAGWRTGGCMRGGH